MTDEEYFQSQAQTRSDQLQTALGFGADDLTSNRDQGRITQAQKRRVRSNLYLSSLVVVVFGLVLIVAAFISGDQIPAYRNGPAAKVLAVVGGLCLMAYATYIMVATETELSRGGVASVHGVLTCQKPSASRHYQLIIDTHVFEARSPLHTAFQSGEIYTIYYLTTRNEIVSAEHHLNAEDQGKDALS